MKLWLTRLLAVLVFAISALALPCPNCEAQAHKQEKQTHSCCSKKGKKAPAHAITDHACRTGCCQAVASVATKEVCKLACSQCCPQPCPRPATCCCLHPEQVKIAEHWKPLMLDATPTHNQRLYWKYRKVRT